jgi:hypothetical protein
MIQQGADPKAIASGKKVSVPKSTFSEPLYMPKNDGTLGPKIRTVRLMVPAGKIFPISTEGVRSKAFVAPGNNHHIVIFEREHNGKPERWSQVVSLFEVVKRLNQNEAPIMREKEDWDFYCSLQANDLFIPGISSIDEYDIKKHKIYRVQKITDGEITLRKHNVAILDVKQSDGSYFTPGRLFKTPNNIRGIKVKISPIGKLEECYD